MERHWNCIAFLHIGCCGDNDNGFLLTEEPDGVIRSRHLNDLEPAQLHQLMQQLIPSIRESLRGAKQTQDSLAGDLEAIHDALAENL